MAYVRSHCTPSSALADGGARCSVVTSRTRASITRMILPRIIHSYLCSWCAALCVPPVPRLEDVPFRRTRCGYDGLSVGGLDGMHLLTPDVRRLPQLPQAQPWRALDLVGMAHEPPFETARRHLGVALEGQTPHA